MTKALSRDPIALYGLLRARRRDLVVARRDAISHRDGDTLRAINAAMGQIDEALVKVVAHLNEIAAAEEQEAEAAPEEAAPAEAEAAEEPEAEGPVTEPETESPADAETDEVLEEETPVEAEPETPSVAMKTTLRRAMGDLAADLLDDYALKIQKSVNTFFENLTQKALDLGTEDPSDDRLTLREQLLTEIGRRGLEQVEPHFLEWREGLIKQLMKDVARTFEAPEPVEAEPELDVPTGEVPEELAEAEVPSEPEPTEETEAPVEEAEAPAEEAPVEEAEAPPEEMPPLKMPASVSASVMGRPVVAQTVSFTLHRDLRPTSARSIKLT